MSRPQDFFAALMEGLNCQTYGCETQVVQSNPLALYWLPLLFLLWPVAALLGSSKDYGETPLKNARPTVSDPSTTEDKYRIQLENLFASLPPKVQFKANKTQWKRDSSNDSITRDEGRIQLENLFATLPAKVLFTANKTKLDNVLTSATSTNYEQRIQLENLFATLPPKVQFKANQTSVGARHIELENLFATLPPKVLFKANKALLDGYLDKIVEGWRCSCT